VATKNPITRIRPAQAAASSSLERIAQNPSTCPHSIPTCPVCRATDELLRIVNTPKPRLFSWLRLEGAR
jgi:hypothetical protein